MYKNITWLITLYLLLVTIGIFVLQSASSSRDILNPSYYVLRQCIWLLLSLVIGYLFFKIDYHLFKKFVLIIAFISLLLLVIVRIPNIGTNINGSWRWLQIGPLTIQPSEFAKPAFLIILSWWLSRNMRRLKEFKYGVLTPSIILLLFAFPILIEPDYGTTLLISSVGISLIYISGVNIKPLIGLALLGIITVGIMVLNNKERLGRIAAFLDPEGTELTSGYQLSNSLRAFASGGFSGVGFGESMQKFDYLPEAHTDFIFPIIGEEFGLIASLLVVLLYILLFIVSMNISRHSHDDFGRLLGYGISLMISVQALINLLVVTGWAPTKGLALPFISYGGSSLLSSSIMIGILLSIGIDSSKGFKSRKRKLFKDRSRSL